MEKNKLIWHKKLNEISVWDLNNESFQDSGCFIFPQLQVPIFFSNGLEKSDVTEMLNIEERLKKIKVNSIHG